MARSKWTGTLISYTGEKSGNVNPSEALENPEQKGSDKRRIVSRKPVKCGKFTAGQSRIYRYGVEARARGVSKSDSLFHSINGGCLQPGKGVWAFKTFRFSVGSLDAPVITAAEREGWTVTLHWKNGANCPKADSSDWVFLGYFYDTLRRSPQLTLDYMPRRIDEKITIEIPPADQPEGTRLHLYLFFGNEEFTQFSPSEYVEL